MNNLECSLIDEAKQRKRKNTDENSKLQTQIEIDEDIDDIFGQTSEGRPFGSEGRPFGPEGRPFGSEGRPFGSEGRPLGEHKDDLDQHTDEKSSRMTDVAVQFSNKNENFESAKKKTRYDDSNPHQKSPKSKKMSVTPKKDDIAEEARKRKAIHDSKNTVSQNFQLKLHFHEKKNLNGNLKKFVKKWQFNFKMFFFFVKTQCSIFLFLAYYAPE